MKKYFVSFVYKTNLASYNGCGEIASEGVSGIDDILDMGDSLIESAILAEKLKPNEKIESVCIMNIIPLPL